MSPSLRWTLAVALVLSAPACREHRARDDEVTFAAVTPILRRACADCHGADQAAAGLRLTSYYDAIGCSEAGTPLVLPRDERAPLFGVLARVDHATLLAPAERAALLKWVKAGAPGPDSRVHGSAILDPRSAGWHGTLARENGFEALRDPAAEAACGRCHDGAPVRPREVRFAAPNAPACTSCHDQPGGVLACSTCHGRDQRPYPPRDPCYFEAGAGAAHQAHVAQARFREAPFACATCHPVPGTSVLAEAHANGAVEVQFASLAAGADARFDAQNGSCAVACHARGGEHPLPSWTMQLALDCNACHLSPPRDHYPGACSNCHAQMGESADSLRAGSLHLNGAVDVGSGNGTCGACHGEGSDAWPRDPLHRAHRDTQLTSAIPCDSCHLVPTTVSAPGHLDGRADLQLAGRALFPGRQPTFDAASKSCREVACHAGPLAEALSTPRWIAPAAAEDGCRSCHRTPPALPHVQQMGCGGELCHGAEVRASNPNFGITLTGRALHMNGVIEAGFR